MNKRIISALLALCILGQSELPSYAAQSSAFFVDSVSTDTISENEVTTEATTEEMASEEYTSEEISMGEVETETAPTEKTTQEERILNSYAESGTVTIKDEVIAVSGYVNGSIQFELDNPNQEEITEARIRDSSGAFIIATAACDQYNKIIPNTYQAKIPLLGINITDFYPEVIINGKTITGPKVYLKAKTMSDKEITVKHLWSGVKSAKFEFTFEPFYKEDKGVLNTYIYYRKKGSSETFKSMGSNTFLATAVLNVYISLTPKTEYEYYFMIADSNNKVLYSGKDKINYFTTIEDKTYQESDFPDTVFLEAIKKKIYNRALTDSELERINELDLNYESKKVKTIEGIQYLHELEYLSVEGHEIENVEKIQKLNKLKVINFSNNYINHLPDMSQMTKLESANFQTNFIPQSQFTPEKLPTLLNEKNPDWISQQSQKQRPEKSIVTAPVYYAIGEKRPFILEASKLDYAGSYTMEITINGVTKEAKGIELFDLQRFIVDDMKIPAGTYEAMIRLRNPNGIVEAQELIKMEFADDNVVNNTNYLTTSDSKVRLNLKLPYEGTISKIIILDNQKNMMGICSEISAQEEKTDYRYYDIFSNTDYNLPYFYQAVTADLYLSSYLPVGEYDARIIMQDATEYIIKGAIAVKKEPMVTGLSNADNFSSAGEFVYLTLNGQNLDFEKICPVIRYQGNVISKFEKLINGKIYCLKKVNWPKSNLKFDWGIQADSDYEYKDIADSHKIKFPIKSLINEHHYNYKKNIYEFYPISTISDGTEVQVMLSNYYNNTFVAEGKGSVENGRVQMQLKDSNQEIYLPKERYRIKYKFLNEAKDCDEFDAKIPWYNYSEAEENTKISCQNFLYQRNGYKEDILQFLVEEDYYQESAEYTAGIYNEYNGLIGNKTVLTPKEKDEGYLLTGQWSSGYPMQEGCYQIVVMQDSVAIETFGLCIYNPEKTYISFENFKKNMAGEYEWYIYSPGLIGEYKHQFNEIVNKEEVEKYWNEHYNVKILDVRGVEIKGWHSELLSYDREGIKLTLKNLEPRPGYYIKLTDKKGNAPTNLEFNNRPYYQTVFGTEEYGHLFMVNSGVEILSDKQGYTGVYTENESSLVCTFLDASGKTTLNEFIVTPDQSGYYYFSEKDIPAYSENEIYLCILNWQGGKTITQKGYFKCKDTQSLTQIALNKTALDLEPEQTEHLKVTFLPEGSGMDAAVVWKSSDSQIASVEDGTVTAINAGQAVITASVKVSETKTLRAKCIVNVTKVLVPEEVPSGLQAVVNITKTLNDVKLPEGWVWKEPKTSLAGLEGKRNFNAIYSKEGKSFEKPINVAIAYVKGLDIDNAGDSNVIQVGKTASLDGRMSITGTLQEENKKDFWIEWSIDKPKVGVLEETETNSVMKVNAVAAGSATVTAVLKYKNGDEISKDIVRKTYRVVVTEKSAAEISAAFLEIEPKEDGKYVVDFNEDKQEVYTLTSKASDKYKIAWKSSDSNIAAVGRSSKGENGALNYPITIKKAGYVELIGVSDDPFRTSKKLLIKVTNEKPQIVATSITINKASKAGTSFKIYPSFEKEISEVSLKVNEGQNLSPDAFVIVKQEENNYLIKKADTAELQKRSYRAELSVKVEEKEYIYPIRISVEEKLPSVSVKQDKKVNLFYTDEQGMGGLKVTVKGDVSIAKMELTECSFTYEDGKILKKQEAVSSVLDKKGKLLIFFNDYEKIEKEITISTEDRAPSLQLSKASSALYKEAGIHQTVTTVLDKLTKKELKIEDAALTIKEIKNKPSLFDWSIKDNEITLLPKQIENCKAENSLILQVKLPNWSRPVELRKTIKIIKTMPSLQMVNKTLTMNKNAEVWEYERAFSALQWKDNNAFVPTDVQIIGKDDKAKAVLNNGIKVSYEDGMLKAQINNPETIRPITYNMVVNAKIGEKIMTSAFAIRIVDKNPMDCISLSARGSINAVDRENTSTVYTIKTNGLNGTIQDVEITGISSSVFAVQYADGKVVVTAKEDVSLVTKYAYPLQFRVTMEEDGQTYQVNAKPTTLKVVQINPKVSVGQQKGEVPIFFKTAENILEMEFSAVTKNMNNVQIDNITMEDASGVFGYDKDRRNFSLKNPGAVTQGKFYTVKFQITYKGAAENERPVTVIYKVIIK